VSSSVPYLSPARLRTALAIRDLSDPGRGPHAIQILIDRAVEALSRAWSCEVRWCRGIPDIRLLRSAEPRIAGQMRDLIRYRPVSSMPPITRDLSVAVAEDEDEETLGDRVRDALGGAARYVEEVRVLSTTACDRLPASAARRLRARPGPEEPPRPGRAQGPGDDADERGRQLPPRPHLPGDSRGDGVSMGSSRRVAGCRVSIAWRAGGSFVMSARSPGVRLRTLLTAREAP
jgi:hypothetical protein